MSAQERPRAAQERPKSGPRAAKSGPRAAKSGPRAAKSGPRAAKRAPRAAKSVPKAAQEQLRVAKINDCSLGVSGFQKRDVFAKIKRKIHNKRFKITKSVSMRRFPFTASQDKES